MNSRRHLYIPIVEMGHSRSTASITVFFISAFFHEYLVSVPLKTFKIWAFMGMMGQVSSTFLPTRDPLTVALINYDLSNPNKRFNPGPSVNNNNSNYNNSSQVQNDRQYEKKPYTFNKNNNKGPYGVWIKKIKFDDKEINASKVGYVLHKNGYSNVIDILRKGRYRTEIIFKTADEANRLISDKNLAEYNWEVFIPGHRKSRKGIIKHISEDIPEEAIIADIVSNAKVIDVKRLNRRNKDSSDPSKKWIPSQSVLLTFEGQDLPNEIYLYRVKSFVEPYVSKPLICYNCLHYGHTSKSGRGNPSCIMCGELKHGELPCSSSTPKCIHCQGSHKSIDPSCEIYKKYHLVNIYMAYDNIPFIDAKKIVFGHHNEDVPAPGRTKENFPEISRQQFLQRQQSKKSYLIKKYSDVVVNSSQYTLSSQSQQSQTQSYQNKQDVQSQQSQPPYTQQTSHCPQATFVQEQEEELNQMLQQQGNFRQNLQSQQSYTQVQPKNSKKQFEQAMFGDKADSIPQTKNPRLLETTRRLAEKIKEDKSSNSKSVRSKNSKK